MLFIVFTVEIELRRRDSLGLRGIVHLPLYYLNSIAEIIYPFTPDLRDRGRQRAVRVRHFLHVKRNVTLYQRELRLGECQFGCAIIGHAFEGEQFLSACRLVLNAYEVCGHFMRAPMVHVIPVCKGHSCSEATDFKGKFAHSRRQCRGHYKPSRCFLALAPSSLRSGQPRCPHQGSNGPNCGYPVSPFSLIEARAQTSGDQGACKPQYKQWVSDHPRFEMIDCICHKELLA